MNNTKAFKKIGVRCHYFHPAAISDIPRVVDVLFVLGFSKQDDCYIFRPSNKLNHEAYVANVHRVVVATGFKVVDKWSRNQAAALRIIARAIVNLCPEEARCLFVSAFAEAKLLAGDDVPPPGSDYETLVRACTCVKCRRFVSSKPGSFNDYDSYARMRR